MTTVAIQGIRGSYSEEAAYQVFGNEAQMIKCASFDETFAAVQGGRAEFAIVPVRNSIVGEIAPVVELLRKSGVSMLGEVSLKIHHILAGTHNARIEDIVSVRSHREALKQCSRF